MAGLPRKSLLAALQGSLSHELPADKRALLEQFDGMAPFRNGIRRMAEERGEWAGIPMPLDGEQLVIEPTYRHAAGLMSIGQPPAQEEDPEYAGATLRSEFWSEKRKSFVHIYDLNGRIEWGIVPSIHHFNNDLTTLGCSDAWGIEQEAAALQTLGHLLKHRALKQYLMTGMFLETSQRSRITYCFRKLKPTVALTTHSGKVRILCSLCMHPIAFYANSWAGAMTPTDDVISHLMMMRGDEKMFWRRSNQHPAYTALAGL